MGDPLKDPRFSHLSWDPKFSRVPRKQRKVKIDDRFKSMFTDSKFNERYSVDKRGKKINRKADQDLKRYYELSSSESDEDADEQVKLKSKKTTNKKAKDKTVSESEEKTSSDDEQKSSMDSGNESEHSGGKINLDLARGQGNLVSSSDDDSDVEGDSDSDYALDGDEEILEHKWGELDADAPRVNDITYRLAVCNMDWDRVKAKDLLVLLNSFKPSTGIIKSVKIYPSKFGKKRMAEEVTQGPKELRELDKISASHSSKKDYEEEDDSNLSEDDDQQKNEEDDEGERLKIIQREKIRQYQLNRLKYYYAVVECDSPETANGIYEACDGVEYESSATKIDLRFIPDDTSFDEDTPSDEATDLGDLNAYKPLHFRNAALQQSKVELTWDETSDARKDLVKSIFENQQNLDQLNLKGILASGSSEDEENEEGSANNGKLSLKSLVKDLLQKKVEKSDEKEESFFVRPDNGGKGEETKQEKSKKSSSWQRYLEKRREKRQQQRQEEKETVEKSKKLNCLTKNVDNFDDLPAGIDMNDPYFKEELDKFDNPTELPYEENEDDREIENNEDDTELKSQQLELLLMSGEKSKSKNYNLKKLLKENEITSKWSKKRKKDQISNEKSIEPKNDESDFKINASDPRFSALYTSHLYNIDPTEASYKKTKNMQSLVDEKMKRIVKNDHDMKEVTPIEQITDNKNTQKNEAAELNLLVKKVKSKTNIINSKKKKEKLAKN